MAAELHSWLTSLPHLTQDLCVPLWSWESRGSSPVLNAEASPSATEFGWWSTTQTIGPSLHINSLEFSFPPPNAFPEGPRKRWGCRCRKHVYSPHESLPAVETTAVERKMVPVKLLPLLHQRIETYERGGFSLLASTALKGISVMGRGKSCS